MMDFLTPEVVAILGRGIVFTIFLTLVTSVLSLFLGTFVGMVRLWGRRPSRAAAGIFIDIFRNIPALVLIIFFAFAIPNLFSPELRQALFFNNILAEWAGMISGLSLPYYALAAVMALTLNTSAYLAELFRAGVRTIPREHVDAARSLGATQSLVWRQILIPQGFSAAFPAITTRLIHNMKNTALVSFVAVPEFFHSTQAAITRTFLAVEFLLLAAVIYLLLSLIFSWILGKVGRSLDSRPRERQMAIREAAVS
jgi:His/Glu/Gln/Arg/opine family amino acid ABC transporter permease subunit